ncbi:MAG TPA: hypothetical protein VLI90_11345, partial [Tepidisphaeraceae bacterium]|nr:hypothetical protein [Tepidisphaeraceae bacterium]
MKFPTNASPVFYIPHERNLTFTGRTELMAELHTRFDKGERAQAIHGLGGIGKTQTAIEYAYRHRDDYRFVLWAQANSRETLFADVAAIARRLKLARPEEPDPAVIVRAVR